MQRTYEIPVTAWLRDTKDVFHKVVWDVRELDESLKTGGWATKDSKAWRGLSRTYRSGGLWLLLVISGINTAEMGGMEVS